MNSIVSKFAPYIKNEQIKRLLIFKEGTPQKKNIHFHVRLESDVFLNKQKLSRDVLKTTFKELKGNAQISCHPCKEKDKHHDQYLGASKTYIAKEGNLIYQFGYTDLQIREMIYIGKQIKELADAPLYKKIIILYSLEEMDHIKDPKTRNKLPSRAHWAQIISTIQTYYHSVGRGYFHKTHTNMNLARNIMKELSYKYRIYQLSCAIDELYEGN